MTVINNLPSDLQNLDPGLRMGNVQGLANAVSGESGRTTENAITASTTQTQAGGTVLRAAWTRVTSANASDAVTLGFRAVPGTSFTIINDSGNIVSLFPAVGDKINDAVANAAVTIADNTISRYVCPASGLWFGAPGTLET